MIGSRADHLLIPFVAIGALLFAACGGSGAEPETPEEDALASEGEATEAEPSSEEAEEVSEPAPEEPEETPRSILLREGTLFLVDYTKSDIGKKIEEKCEGKHKDDVAKKANCVSTDLGKLPREGITFDEDDDGNWWYIRFGIEKNNVQVIYNKVQVEVGEPDGAKLTLTPTGKDQARRRHGKGTEHPKNEQARKKQHRAYFRDADVPLVANGSRHYHIEYIDIMPYQEHNTGHDHEPIYALVIAVHQHKQWK
jgi:hypothetical protein